MSGCNSGLQSIENKFLRSGDLFAIKFNQGYVFLSVETWEQPDYKPYSRLGSVSSSSNLGYTQLEDSASDDILYVEDGEAKVKHAAIGHRPAILRRYTRYPEGEQPLGSINNIGSPSSQNGDDFGNVDGVESPYEEPTDKRELMIPPGVHVDFDFFNPDSESHTPILNIKFREYNVIPLRPSRQNDRNKMKGILSPGSPMPIFPAGTKDRQIDYTLDNSWGVEPLSRREVLEGF